VNTSSNSVLRIRPILIQQIFQMIIGGGDHIIYEDERNKQKLPAVSSLVCVICVGHRFVAIIKKEQKNGGVSHFHH